MNLLGLAAAGVIGVAAVGLIDLPGPAAGRGSCEGAIAGEHRARSGWTGLLFQQSSMTTYHVFVGDHKFSFGDDMSSIFHEGDRYNVYYCQSGPYQLIMSFEISPARAVRSEHAAGRSLPRKRFRSVGRVV